VDLRRDATLDASGTFSGALSARTGGGAQVRGSGAEAAGAKPPRRLLTELGGNETSSAPFLSEWARPAVCTDPLPWLCLNKATRPCLTKTGPAVDDCSCPYVLEFLLSVFCMARPVLVGQNQNPSLCLSFTSQNVLIKWF
jgi:hypothetical protein